MPMINLTLRKFHTSLLARTSHRLVVRSLATSSSTVSELKQLLGSKLSTSQAVIDQHASYESYHKPAPADAVAFPTTNTEVAEIVKICRRTKTPIIPWGAGTSLEGHLMALRGGICLDLSQMNRVLEVNSEDLDCRVEAGVTREQLNEFIRDTGLTFPVDPGADASIGGMAATRASGTNAVKYGTMRENVLGLTVVTSDGNIIRTGGRARKSSAGYDLTRLFVGSEGTLGIITEIQLRLHGVPEATSSCICAFPDLSSAVNTVIMVSQLGIPVARMELLDELSVIASNKYSHTTLKEAPTIFFEFHGSEAGVKEQVESVMEISRDNGSTEVTDATERDVRNKLWKARHHLYWAVVAQRPGSKGHITDVCVPVSRLTDCILQTREAMESKGILSPILGHVGDGNFHVIFSHHPDDPPERLQHIEEVYQDLALRAIEMGGTCTGEHGVGIGKMNLLVNEQGEEGVNVMKEIKAALDPDDIFNPGKILYGHRIQL